MEGVICDKCFQSSKGMKDQATKKYVAETKAMKN